MAEDSIPDDAIIIAFTLPLSFAYADTASRVRHLLRYPRALTRLDRTTGRMMMGAGTVIDGS